MSGRVLVTGGTGFIGRALLPLLAGRAEVVVLHRGEPPPGPPGVTWVRRDLSTPDWDTSGLPPVESVVHLAQSLRFREFPAGAADVFQVNLGATERLLEWARACGARRFVLASSGGHDPSREVADGPLPAPGALGHYLASKRAAELVAASWSGQLTVAVLRFFFVYGAGQRPGMLVSRLARAVAAGQAVTLQGPDGLRLNPLHVSDAARALLAALELEQGARIAVAGPETLTLRQVGEELGRQLGIPPRFEVLDEPAPSHLVGDVSLMTRLLGAPRTRFAEGVAEVCREAKATPERA